MIRTHEGRPTILRSVVMIALTAVIAVPLYYIVVSTFKTPIEMAESPLGLPAPGPSTTT